MIFTKITKRAFAGIVDFLILSASLYLAISLRYSIAIGKLGFVDFPRFFGVFKPFLIIIFLNLIVFFMYGLYEKMTIKVYKELDKRIFASQIFSSLLGASIFYSFPIFSIAPKTILIFYIFISTFLIYFWRKSLKNLFKRKERVKILLAASGKEMIELEKELSNNKIINAKKVVSLDLESLESLESLKEKTLKEDFDILAINLHSQIAKKEISIFYELLLAGKQIVNFADLYEDVFQKIPLQNIDAGWLFSNLPLKKSYFYKVSKRVLDILLALPALLISLPFYPLVYIFLKLEDGSSSIFYISERIGKNNKPFKVYKFRSMSNLKNIDPTKPSEAKRVTRFGKFIRKTRIDELPQLLNIILGDISFIGPRPEIPSLVKAYTEEISFYGLRHTIIPGLSGYAQIYQEQAKVPKFGLATSATKEKLAYDIYYLKHRSLSMDISLIIKTIRNLLSRSGV